MLLCCLHSVLVSGLVLPSPLLQPRIVPLSYRMHHLLCMSTKSNGVEFFDDSNMKTTSLFPKRSNCKRKSPIPTLLFLLLRKSIVPNLAWASAAGKSTLDLSRLPTPLSIKNFQHFKAYISNFHFDKQGIKTIFTIGLSIVVVRNLIQNMQAHKRQKVDPTSEWGRYADKPAARGQALSVLLMKLVPYAILPSLMEIFTGIRKKSKDDPDNVTTYNGYSSKEEYETSKAHQLRNKGGGLFADGLLRLGPLYIKIGQILSCRENLFSDEWIAAMSKLQDRVPAKSGRDAWELLYEACPGGKSGFHRLFSDFDDVPLAAASLGQVHTARIRGLGRRVAIKIQRSRLRDIYDKDLALMKKIAKVADGIGGQVGGIEQSWEGIFNDAETILYREIDYRDEADNAIRFANNFGIGLGGEPIESTANGRDGKPLPSAHQWLRTPYTYGDLSSEKFLVMEYVPSIKVNDDAKLDSLGVTIEDREYLAEALAHSYLRQFCTNKFFSTDPHPGNLGVEVFEDDRAPRMVFYDFGQACGLSDDQAGGILEVIESIIDSDAKKSVAAFARMGVLKETADLEKVRAKCQQNYDTGKLLVKKRKKRNKDKYNRVQNKDHEEELEARLEARMEEKPVINGTSTEVKDSEVLDSFTLQSEYAFVARALSQMDGVGKGLDPEFDFISAAAPYIVEVKGTGRYLTDEARKVFSFVYDDNGILAKEMKLFKSLGFDPVVQKKKEKAPL